VQGITTHFFEAVANTPMPSFVLSNNASHRHDACFSSAFRQHGAHALAFLLPRPEP